MLLSRFKCVLRCESSDFRLGEEAIRRYQREIVLTAAL